MPTRGIAPWGSLAFGVVVARHSGGWIKLHRRILAGHSWVGHDCYALAIFVTILLDANVEDGGTYVRQGIIIKRGQLVTSYDSLAKQLGISRSMVRRKVDRMTKDKMLSHQADHVGSIITVLNYDKYQGRDVETGIGSGTGAAQERPHMEEVVGVIEGISFSSSASSKQTRAGAHARTRVDPWRSPSGAQSEARRILAKALGAPARAVSEDEEEIWTEVGWLGRAVISVRYKAFRRFWEAYVLARRHASQTIVDGQLREEFAAILTDPEFRPVAPERTAQAIIEGETP